MDDIEQAKTVTTATLRALAGQSQAEVGYSAHQFDVVEDRVTLPLQGVEKLSEHQMKQLRGEADAAALRLRFHDTELHQKLMPPQLAERSLFDRLEQVRVECLGSLEMAGIRQNLKARIEQQMKVKRLDLEERSEALPVDEVLPLYLRHRVINKGIPDQLATQIEAWVKSKGLESERLIELLLPLLGDQQAFAAVAYQLMAAWGVSEFYSEQDNAEGSELKLSFNQVETNQGEELSDNADKGEPEDDVPGMSEGTLDEGAQKIQFISDWLNPDRAIPTEYCVYTREFDEEVEATELATSEELASLRAELDQQLPDLQGAISRTANRLYRHLLIQQRRAWQFDCEEGVVDGARLARIVANPTLPLAFKQETQAEFLHTTVTLLIDNSGSMRGQPIAIAALSADILAHTLERCGVRVEILGFTTKTWRGGRVQEQWQADGQPMNPGRLNELRHIVYKPANLPWRRAKHRFGLMLKKGLLKENIDGEALLWAHKRLMKRPETRKILMVISDGAPVDDATLLANPNIILDQHLRQVIDWIERRTPVQLAAIGIGHDVTHYYQKALMLKRAEDLGGAILKELATMLGAERS